MSSARAVRYRKLALATKEGANADLLLKLADECDRGVLCSAEWILPRRPSVENGHARTVFEWNPGGYGERR